MIEAIGNLGAVYLAFKAADLVFTYFSVTVSLAVMFTLGTIYDH